MQANGARYLARDECPSDNVGCIPKTIAGTPRWLTMQRRKKEERGRSKERVLWRPVADEVGNCREWGWGDCRICREVVRWQEQWRVECQLTWEPWICLSQNGSSSQVTRARHARGLEESAYDMRLSRRPQCWNLSPCHVAFRWWSP